MFQGSKLSLRIEEQSKDSGHITYALVQDWRGTKVTHWSGSKVEVLAFMCGVLRGFGVA